MNLEMRSAKPADLGFAWSLFSQFVFENMFSGATGRRPATDWAEDREYQNFSNYWNAEGRYLITVDDAPIGWAVLTEDDETIVLENWHLIPRWHNRDVTRTILSDLVSQWKAKGLKIEAYLLQDCASSSVLEDLLTKLGFTVGRRENPHKILHSV